MKKFIYIITLLIAMGISCVSNAQLVNVCGTDTVLLKVSNYQEGVIEWMESVDNENWVSIEGANDSTYKFFPLEAKYYKAQVKLSGCSPIESQISFVQVPPVANAGTDRDISGDELEMMANLPEGTLGEWAVIKGENGSFSNVNDAAAIFSGTDSTYSLVWTLTNTCGSSSDTISIAFVKNEYYNNIAIVDETDSILSDSTQLNAGLYIIKFGSMAPVIADSTVLVGIVGDGFIRKVESFSVTNGVYSINTSQGSLMDITVNGVFNLGTLGNMDNLKSAGNSARLSKKPTRAELLTDPKFKNGNYYFEGEESIDYIRPGIVLKDASKQQGSSLISLAFDSEIWSNDYASLRLSGGYDFKPNIAVDFKIGTSWGIPKLKKVKVGMYNGTMTSNYKVTFDASAAANLLDKPFELFNKRKTTTFVIGGTPVVVVTSLKFEGVITVDAEADMHLEHGQTHVNTYTAGAEYSKGKWSYPYYKSEKTTMDNEVVVTGSLAQHFEIGPSLSFKVYGVVGPYVQARLNEDLELCMYNQNWQAKFDISGSIKVGAKAKIAGYKLFDVNKTWSKGFYNLELPAKLSYVSGNNQYYREGEELSEKVTIKATSNKGFAVPGVIVYFKPKNGGSVSTPLMVTNFKGEASAYWSPGGESLSFLEVSVKNCDGDNLSKSPIVFSAISDLSQLACAKSSFTASIKHVKLKSALNYRTPNGENGVTPYTYSDDGGETYSSTAPKLYTNWLYKLLHKGEHHVYFVKDAAGCIAVVSYTVGESTSDLQIETVAQGNQIMAQGIAGDPPYKYAINDIEGNYSEDNVFVDLPVGGYSVFVKDNEGYVSSRIEYVSGTKAPVVANFAISKSVAAVNDIIQFADMSDNASSWHWDFGDGTSSSDQNPEHAYQTAGTYTVTLTATEEHGFSDTKIQRGSVMVGEVPFVNFTISDTEACINKPVKFTNLASPTGVNSRKRRESTDWLWDFGDESTSEEVNPSHVYTSGGLKNISLTVSNKYGENSKTYSVFVQPFPIANFSADKTVAAVGNSIQFSALPQVTIVSDTVVAEGSGVTTITTDTIVSDNASSWLWDFGDGTSSDLKNPIHNYTSPGNYTITLSVSNDCGNSNTLQKTEYIEVGNPPVANFSISDTTPTVGEVVTFTDLSTKNPSNWFWRFGDGYISSQKSPDHIYKRASIESVSLTVKNRFGEDVKTLPIEVVEAIPPVVANFEAEVTSAAVGEEIFFMDFSEYATSWLWDFGDGNTSTEQNPMKAYASVGTYTVKLTVSDGITTDTKTIDNYIEIGLVPQASFSVSDTTPTVDNEVTFTDLSTGNPTSWFWDFGDGTTSDLENPAHTFKTPGSKTVSLIARNAFGETLHELIIEVVEAIPPVVANFEAEVTIAAVEEEIFFMDFSEYATSWIWDFGDGNTSTEQNPMKAYASVGTYTVKLTVSDGITTDTKTIDNYIEIGLVPQASFSVSDTTPTVDNEVTFTDLSTGNPTSWLWDFGDGTTSELKNPAHTFETPGSKTVSLIARNAFGENVHDLAIEVKDKTTFTDVRDGTVYNLVKIGTQTWMVENLAWLPSIDTVNEDNYWDLTSTPAYYINGYSGNDVDEAKATDNYKNYGVWYNEPAAKIAAPEGWHLPTLEEWQELISFLSANGYSGIEGNALKSCRQVNSINSAECATDVHPRWDEDASNYGSNVFGFSALPAGEASAEMGTRGMNSIWWTYSIDEVAEEAPVVIINANTGTVEISTDVGFKSLGYSVRCIKD